MNTSLVHKPLNDTRMKDLFSAVSALGNAEGKGANAKPDYARAVLEASIDGIIASTDAETLWAKYSTAVRNTKGDEHTRMDTKSDKVRVSETKRFIMVGAMLQVDPMNLFERSVDLIHNNDVTGSTYQNLTKIMREQCKVEGQALTDEEIIAVICPSPADKTEKKLLESILKTMKRTHDGTKGDVEKGIESKPGFPSEELAEAITQIEVRLASFVRAEVLDATIKAIAIMSPDDRKLVLVEKV